MLEDVEEDAFDFFVGLAVHNVIPIGVFYFLLADFCVGLGCASLQL